MVDKSDSTTGGSGDDADDPGRPFPPGELDPELIKLPRARTRVGPVLSASVVILCVYLLVKLTADLGFAMAGDEPIPFDSPMDLVTKGELNQFVEVRASPDRTFGALVRTSLKEDGHRLMPVVGTGEKLWLMTRGDHWHAELAYDEVHAGRLLRLGDMGFFDATAAQFEVDKAHRVVTRADLERALADTADTMVDSFGDSFKVGSNTQISANVVIPDQVDVICYSTESLNDQDKWLLALKQVGLEPEGNRAFDEQADHWVFRVKNPGGLSAVAEKLASAEVFAASARAVRQEHRGAMSVVNANDQGLSFDDSDRVTWGSVESLMVFASHGLPADAMVVVATARPSQFWYTLPVMILVLLIGLYFAWIMIEALRFPRAQT